MDAMNLHLMLPEIYLILLGLTILIADLDTTPEKRFNLGWWTAGGLAVLAVWLFSRPTPESVDFAGFGLYRVDGFALFMKKVFALTGILVAVMSTGYIRRYGRGPGEFFSIVLFALTGMFMVASVNDFMSLFVALELVTLCLFILATYRRHDRLSGEAGIKYIIVGAMAAGLMLFGMAFIYGATGEVRFAYLAENGQMVLLSQTVANLGSGWQMTALFGFAVLLVGLGFKVAAVPFHVWVPDVYQGAPTPITAFLSVGSKAAGFILIIRVITLAVPTVFPDVATDLVDQLVMLFALVAGLTLFYGNLAAIPQKNLKRLMGFSSIGHAGYLLLGIVAVLAMKAAGVSGEEALGGVSAIAFYLFAYLFTNMALFIGMVIFTQGSEESHAIDDYAGLGKRAPLLALCMTISLLSLAGVPPLAGFFGKFYLISSIVEAASIDGYGWLLVLAAAGAVNVVISMYYYLCVVKRMYMFEPTSDEPVLLPAPARIAMLACVLLVVLIGIFQGPFVRMATSVLATLGF
jgi:NADH-quinone oxidoreductase subunit N